MSLSLPAFPTYGRTAPGSLSAARLWTLTLVGVLAVCAFVFSLNVPYIGDDLVFDAPYFVTCWWWPWGWGPVCWLITNGRMANFITIPLLVEAPQWVLAAINAIATGLFYAALLKAAGLLRDHRAAAATLTVALVAWAFPWWDQMCQFDVSANYLWTAALALLFTGLWIKGCGKRGLAMAGMALLGFIGGAMHEATGAPVAAALWLTLKAAGAGRARIAAAAAWTLGALVPLTSPAIWSRFGAAGAPDDPMALLLVKSCFLGLLLAALVALALTSRRGRRTVARLWHTDTWWRVAVLVAAGNMVFVAVGGIVGRSGWTCLTFSLVALVRLAFAWGLPRLAARTGAAIALAAGAIVIWQQALTAHIQAGLLREYRAFEREYTASPDGIVFFDITCHADLPMATLHRNATVPDADDAALLMSLARAVHPLKAVPRVLPAALHNLDWHHFEGTLEVGRGMVSTHAPALPLQPMGMPGRGVWLAPDGREMVTMPFRLDGRKFYWTEPREKDPGDRYTPQ